MKLLLATSLALMAAVGFDRVAHADETTTTKCEKNSFDEVKCTTTTSPDSSPSKGPSKFIGHTVLGITAGRGYHASYADGTESQSSFLIGFDAEAVFGGDRGGIAMLFAVERDQGTSPDPATPADSMWTAAIGIGFVLSPVAIVRRAELEVRPEVGLYGLLLHRLGCNRCETSLPFTFEETPAESDGGAVGRLRAGVSIYWGPDRAHGMGIDLLFQLSELGDAADPLSSAVLTPPQVLLRLSWIPTRVH